jgi:hypothetical protein
MFDSVSVRISEAIDRISLLGVGRGTARAQELNKLYHAARRGAAEPLSARAARRLEAVLAPGATTVILTGAGGPPSLPRGETDGPPGAAVLARGLVLAFGARPVLVAEARLRAPIVAALDALADGSRVNPWRRSIRFATFPSSRDFARSAAATLWDGIGPAAVIAVERLGPNRRGVIHNARGEDVTATHAGVEALFSLARQAGVLTIGVGDRGNELGFGSIKPRRPSIAPVDRPCVCPCRSGIACAIPAEVVVVASVSNWGAYAIVASLAMRLGDLRLLHRPADETRMLAACVSAGARDGISREGRLTVDGLSGSMQRTIVMLLRDAVAAGTGPGHDIR